MADSSRACSPALPYSAHRMAGRLGPALLTQYGNLIGPSLPPKNPVSPLKVSSRLIPPSSSPPQPFAGLFLAWCRSDPRERLNYHLIAMILTHSRLQASECRLNAESLLVSVGWRHPNVVTCVRAAVQQAKT